MYDGKAGLHYRKSSLAPIIVVSHRILISKTLISLSLFVAEEEAYHCMASLVSCKEKTFITQTKLLYEVTWKTVMQICRKHVVSLNLGLIAGLEHYSESVRPICLHLGAFCVKNGNFFRKARRKSWVGRPTSCQGHI